MTLEELLDELRTTRLDDTVAPYLWSDAELVGYLNDAVRQVCIRKRALLEAVNPKVCRLPFEANQRLLKLHVSVIAVRAVFVEESDDYPEKNELKGITSQRLAKSSTNWINDNEDRCLRHWVPDVQERHIALSGLPKHAGALQLHVWRMPLETEVLDAADPTGEPVINETWHMDLCDWAEYRAYGKKDAETIDNGRRSAALSSFEAKVGRLPSMTEIRVWGIQPITSTIPEFI